MELEEFRADAKKYVEAEFGCKVLSVSFKDSFNHFDGKSTVLLVKTDDKEYSEWWVIGSTLLKNIYCKAQFPDHEEAFIFHVGLMIRERYHEFERTGLSLKEWYSQIGK